MIEQTAGKWLYFIHMEQVGYVSPTQIIGPFASEYDAVQSAAHLTSGRNRCCQIKPVWIPEGVEA